MSESQAPATCAICLAPAPRLPAAPRLNLMPSNNRIAESRNEKSAHEPDVVHRLAGHDSHAQGRHDSHKHSAGPAHMPHPSPRPWMLGH